MCLHVLSLFSLNTKKMKNIYWLNSREAVLVSPCSSLPVRVKKFLFDSEEQEGNKSEIELAELASCCTFESYILPQPSVHINKNYTTNRPVDLIGISKGIDRKFYRPESKFYCKRRIRAGEAQKLGIQIDKELKLFAKGYTSWDKIKHKESKAIITHLFCTRNISLVNSQILVTNYTDAETNNKRTFSVTEIDLLGFDHKANVFVVIEIKCTGKYMSSLLKEQENAEVEKTSGFTKSQLGKYAAQLACTTLMLKNTYPTLARCEALLVVCEIGIASCHSLHLKKCYEDKKRFSGWLAGF